MCGDNIGCQCQFTCKFVEVKRGHAYSMLPIYMTGKSVPQLCTLTWCRNALNIFFSSLLAVVYSVIKDSTYFRRVHAFRECETVIFMWQLTCLVACNVVKCQKLQFFFSEWIKGLSACVCYGRPAHSWCPSRVDRSTLISKIMTSVRWTLSAFEQLINDSDKRLILFFSEFP